MLPPQERLRRALPFRKRCRSNAPPAAARLTSVNLGMLTMSSSASDIQPPPRSESGAVQPTLSTVEMITSIPTMRRSGADALGLTGLMGRLGRIGLPTRFAGGQRKSDLALAPRNPQAVEDQIILRLENPSDPSLLGIWRSLLGQSESAEKIYQSPEFLQFLGQSPDGDRFALYSVTRRHDASIIGLVPVRIGHEKLDLSIGSLSALSPRMKVVRILGSVAPMPQVGAMIEQVIAQLFVHFPDAAAISMQAVPAGSSWWQSLTSGAATRTYVLNDWRDCHTMGLPENFDEYLKQFSAKKRYNLNRQVKQLEKEAGELVVRRVTDVAGVPVLYATALALAAPAQRNGLLAEHEYTALAGTGLLLSYVITCGGVPCGAVIGSLSCGVWHVYKILWSAQYAALSIGTSVLHVSIKDAMSDLTVASIDLGYGSPNRDFNSSHQLKKRAHVLVYRATARNRLAVLTHAGVTAVALPLRRVLKALPKQIATVRAGVAARLRRG